jgi:hypothetical protein
MSGAIPPILTLVRPPESPIGVGLVAAKVRTRGPDRIAISAPAQAASAARAAGSLSPFRSAADRNEAATGVARGRLVDRQA